MPVFGVVMGVDEQLRHVQQRAVTPRTKKALNPNKETPTDMAVHIGMWKSNHARTQQTPHACIHVGTPPIHAGELLTKGGACTHTQESMHKYTKKHTITAGTGQPNPTNLLGMRM